jgi:hypothetical protein
MGANSSGTDSFRIKSMGSYCLEPNVLRNKSLETNRLEVTSF